MSLVLNFGGNFQTSEEIGVEEGSSTLVERNNFFSLCSNPGHSSSSDGFGDSCILLLGNHVLTCITIVGVKKLAIFLHKTVVIWPTDQMHQKLKSPSISLCLPT